MKKYKKKPNKLLQIRLSEKEYSEIIDFIKIFKVTQREWLLTVLNELRKKTIIRDNYFWENWKEYAYFNNDKWDKKIDEDSVCEECGAGNPNSEEKGKKQL